MLIFRYKEIDLKEGGYMIQHNTLPDTEKKDKDMNTLFSMLDEAIDDMENGRVVSEEEMWSRLAKVGTKN